MAASANEATSEIVASRSRGTEQIGRRPVCSGCTLFPPGQPQVDGVRPAPQRWCGYGHCEPDRGAIIPSTKAAGLRTGSRYIIDCCRWSYAEFSAAYAIAELRCLRARVGIPAATAAVSSLYLLQNRLEKPNASQACIVAGRTGSRIPVKVRAIRPEHRQTAVACRSARLPCAIVEIYFDLRRRVPRRLL